MSTMMSPARANTTSRVSVKERELTIDDHTSTTDEIDDDYEGVEIDILSNAGITSVLEMEEDNEDNVLGYTRNNGGPNQDGQDDELSWRLDPKESLSDWTIMIKTKHADKVDTYYVHKSVLGVGPRRSNYFATAFRKVEEGDDRQRFMQQQQQNLKAKSQSYYGSTTDMFFLGEFTDFVLSGATPLLDLVGSEHRYKDGDQNATYLELDEPEASAFPALLDYCYGSHRDTISKYGCQHKKRDELHISTESATALHHLGIKLEMKLLRKEAREFWKKDLGLHNLLVYYKHARLLGDDLVAKYAAGCLSVAILDLSEKQVVDYLRNVDADFMLQVLHFLVEQHLHAVEKLSLIQAIQSKVSHSKRLSLLVAIYCNLHRNDPLSLSTLNHLTDVKHVPELDAKAAQVLLEIENEVSGDNSTLTSLKRRCISVLSKNWDNLQLENGAVRTNSVDEYNDPYNQYKGDAITAVSIPRLEGAALAHFVVCSLTRAKRQLDEMEAIRREWQDLKGQVHFLTEQVEKIQRVQGKDYNRNDVAAVDDDGYDESEEQDEDDDDEHTPIPTTPTVIPEIDNSIRFF